MNRLLKLMVQNYNQTVEKWVTESVGCVKQAEFNVEFDYFKRTCLSLVKSLIKISTISFEGKAKEFEKIERYLKFLEQYRKKLSLLSHPDKNIQMEAQAATNFKRLQIFLDWYKALTERLNDIKILSSKNTTTTNMPISFVVELKEFEDKFNALNDEDLIIMFKVQYDLERQSRNDYYERKRLEYKASLEGQFEDLKQKREADKKDMLYRLQMIEHSMDELLAHTATNAETTTTDTTQKFFSGSQGI